MRSFQKLTAAAVLVAGLVGIAMAQPPGGGGRMMGGGGGVANLLRSKTVLEDLKVSEDQKTKLTTWAKDFGAKSIEMMKEKMKDIPKEEMREKMGAIMSEMSALAIKEIGTVLDEKQVKRLKQIEIQVAGARAFGMKDVQDAMKLTDDQKDKLKDANDGVMKEMRDLREEYGMKGFGGPKLDADKQKEFDKKSGAITKELWTKVTGMLTDDQKKTWKELTGPEIDVTKVTAETAFGGGFPGKKKKDD